jgi:Bacteriophage protein gp37
MSFTWNPWHGCHKLSEGCRNCYVYRQDAKHEKKSGIISLNSFFDMPIKRNKKGEYKIPSRTLVFTCLTSDFFLDEADQWRPQAWEMIRQRQDLMFFIFTKRVDRIEQSLPPDWDNGYDNVTLSCSIENQDRANFRLPIFKSLPAKHKSIIFAPLLSDIDASAWLDNNIELVSVGGESGNEARILDYNWVLHIRQHCVDKDISFLFQQTGARMLKDGKEYRIIRKFQHSQAKKANINYKEVPSLYQ